ncbi:PREDICTED: wall-associated receptor kinase-like 22 isoform X1 [Fragaria vesca subsp. vesca]|uniref:wall-associated receptor kinase-like 22 isoform X1 n=1 Tax=Fragaria vesca subsp. vesca TaxID=101020 RepID=UPI0002C3650A|nr:PREDICTED: wall-associated receptor kinase-like 22 isoform X1 [Fragaria vesca subsp. vesca]
MLSWFTLASILLLFTAIPLEANSNQKEFGDLNLTTSFSGPTGKGSGSSLGNSCLEVLCSSTNLEQEVQASSFAKVRVNKSIYGYSNCSFYTGAGATMLQSHKVHAAMNLKDHTTSNTIANNFTTVIGYESFGFIGYEPLTLNINSPLADQEDGACSGIGYCHSSIPRRIEYSFAKEAESIVNITLLSMYIWYTMRVGVTGTPSKSSLILPLSMVGNVSSARQLYYENMAVPQNYGKGSVHSLIEVGTREKLVYDMAYLPHSKVFHANFTVGLGFCCLFIVFGITGIYSSVKNQKLVKHKSKFFQKNGGLLLQQHINASTTRGRTTIFTSKELEMTMNYHKKSHTFSPEDYGVQRFVNEIITLTQINHQNVVKFFGCCLETEAPILVYELASSGTLFDYIHHRNGRSSLPWDVLLKIASESAAALAYLHSASIIHGNVKSSNILLTDCFMAKVVGLRPSRLVPSNESQIITLFQRTLGYLDPEYLHKGQLTDKSDVYSFGMVLLEIVTGEKPISFGRPECQRIISSHFVLSMESQSGLFDQIVGAQVLKQEQEQEQVRAVAELAKRCLSLSSAERPAMEEVARELTMLRS